MTTYTNHAQKMLGAQSVANDVSKRLREEYIETLATNTKLGTTRGGAVSQFGFPAAADLLAGLADTDFNGESIEHRHVAPAPQPAPVGPKPVRVHSLEQFAAMLEVMQARPVAEAREARAKVVA